MLEDEVNLIAQAFSSVSVGSTSVSFYDFFPSNIVVTQGHPASSQKPGLSKGTTLPMTCNSNSH